MAVDLVDLVVAVVVLAAEELQEDGESNSKMVEKIHRSQRAG